MTTPQAERCDFEVHAGKRCLSLKRSDSSPDEYANHMTQEAWAAWARRAGIEVQERPQRVATAAEMRRAAAHDSSCVGAFARARP